MGQEEKKQEFVSISKWVEDDCTCEVESLVASTHYDPQFEDTREMVIIRYRTLVDTGVTIKGVDLSVICFPEYWGSRYETRKGQYNMTLLEDERIPDNFCSLIEHLYELGQAVESLTIEVEFSL